MPARTGGSSAAQLNYVIAARDAQFQRVADRVTRRLERLERSGRQAARGTNQLHRSLTGLAAIKTLFGGVLGGIGLARLNRELSESIMRVDRLAKLARNIDLPVAEFQAWRQAAREAGVQQEKFAVSLQRFQQFIGDTAVRDSKEYRDVWEQLGVNFRNSNGDIRDTRDLFYEVLDGLRDISSTAVQQSLVQQLFGRGGRDLRAFLSGGSQDLREFTREFNEARRGIDEGTAALAEALQNLRDSSGKELENQLDRLLVRMDNWLGVTERLVRAQRGLADIARSVGDAIGSQQPGRQTDPVSGFGDMTRPGQSFLRTYTPEELERIDSGSPLQVTIDRGVDYRLTRGDPGRLPGRGQGRRYREGLERRRGQLEQVEAINYRLGRQIQGVEAEAAEEAQRLEEEREQRIIRFNEEQAAALEALAARAQAVNRERLQQIQRQAEEEERRIQRMRAAFSDMFTDLVAGTTSFGDFFERILAQTLNNIISQGLSNPLSQQIGGGALAFLGFGRQRGGPVARGQRYLVGEGGPEVFTPRTSGVVAPIMRGASSPTVNLTFNISSSDGPGVRAALREAEPRLTAAALSAVSQQQSRPGSILGRQNRGAG